MFHVYGVITVKETGERVPNLEVALFDSDDRQLDPLHLEKGGASQGGEWSLDRIGSVLTDAAGEFDIRFETGDFRTDDRDARPDLALAVFAPGEPQGPEDPEPPALRDRLLYLSRVPRRDAGRTEAYAIRLPEALLGGSQAIASHVPLAEAARQAASTLRLWDSQAVLRKQIGNQIRERGSARLRLLSGANKKFADLQAADPARRKDPLFLPVAQQRKGLGPALEGAFKDGLKRAADYRGSLRLRLSDGEMKELGLELIDGEVRGEPRESELMAVVSERTGGTDLVRVRALVDGCDRPVDPVAAIAEDGSTPDRDNEDDDNDDDNDDGAISTAGWTPEEAERRLLAQTMEQVRALEPDAVDESLPRRADAAAVQQVVDSLRLAGGPADATAYHDFHALQIAFKHVWTEAFDGDLKEKVGELYEHMVQVREEHGLPSPDASAVTEVEQLRELLNTTRGELRSLGSIAPVPEEVRDFLPEITQEQWNALSLEQQQLLQRLASRPDRRQEGRGVVHVRAPSDREGSSSRRVRGAVSVRVTAEAPEVVARRVLDHPEGSLGRAQRLILDLHKRLQEPFSFDVIAPSSYNFGVMVTYRQKWEPLGYQAGDLVATIPLAPGERRKYTKRQSIRKTRAEKEIEKSLASRSDESSQVRRAEAEILDRASTATNFKMSAQGSFSIGVADISGSSEFSMNQAEESARNKKDFREATLKSARDYRHERALEVETTSSTELDSTTSGEIANPNNEIAVTYLFYELQRRYRISEFVQRVRPVIMVAQDVPAPHEIDEEWLLANEWILRRVMLDDRLLPALDYLSEGFTGDEFSTELKRANWEAQQRLVDKLEAAVSHQMEMRDALREKLIETALNKDFAAAGESTTAEDVGGLLTAGPVSLLFGSDDEGDTERQEALRKAAETRLGYAEEALRVAQERLLQASESRNAATREHADALDLQLNRRTAIDQLRVHIKENILYYMQAIWDHEPPDQRFFRLYDLKVKLTRPESDCRLRPVKENVPGAHPGDRRTVIKVENFCRPTLAEEEVDLVQIADLDHPLGYKGNYIVFPLREPCHLTSHMMREFVDDYFGVRDPDELGDYSNEELADYIGCVWHRDDLSDADREALREQFLRRMSEPRRSSDEIVVPTGQLFIEALPGRHPLLEDFKLRHRREDVRAARAGVRHAELENLRLAARLVAGEREDPDVDKRVVLDGGASLVVPE